MSHFSQVLYSTNKVIGQWPKWSVIELHLFYLRNAGLRTGRVVVAVDVVVRGHLSAPISYSLLWLLQFSSGWVLFYPTSNFSSREVLVVGLARVQLLFLNIVKFWLFRRSLFEQSLLLFLTSERSSRDSGPFRKYKSCGANNVFGFVGSFFYFSHLALYRVTAVSSLSYLLYKIISFPSKASGRRCVWRGGGPQRGRLGKTFKDPRFLFRQV